MDSKYTPISLISFKNILEENFNDFSEIRVWGSKTKPQTIDRDDNFPIALAFNGWPRIKVKLTSDLELHDDKLLFSVSFAGKKYIGLLDQVNELGKDITFSNKLYRSEMREEERLVCYPHRNVYLYTPCPKLEGANVLEFKSPNSPEMKKQLEIREKFIKRSDKLEEGDLIGMRAFDLSSTGISIVTSREELDLLENFIDEMTFKLSFLGTTYSLKSVSFVHSNNLILPGIRDSKLFKVGLSFEYNEEIYKANQELIEAAITLEELEEDLIKE
jgi:hypothetical protein